MAKFVKEDWAPAVALGGLCWLNPRLVTVAKVPCLTASPCWLPPRFVKGPGCPVPWLEELAGDFPDDPKEVKAPCPEPPEDPSVNLLEVGPADPRALLASSLTFDLGSKPSSMLTSPSEFS